LNISDGGVKTSFMDLDEETVIGENYHALMSSVPLLRRWTIQRAATYDVSLGFSLADRHHATLSTSNRSVGLLHRH